MILAERNDVKRAFIYVFYDPEGIADGYVEKMLSSLREVSSQTLLVVNGDIREECLSALEDPGDLPWAEAAAAESGDQGRWEILKEAVLSLQ